MDISVVIPNYNGKKLLEQHLPSVISAVKNFTGECEIIISDDGSTDESVEFIKKFYLDIKIISSKQNTGFSATVNRGIHNASGEWIMVLNNDVKMIDEYLQILWKYTKDNSVFSLSGVILNQHGKPLDGAKPVYFRKGCLRVVHNHYPLQEVEKCLTFYNPAVACLYRKKYIVLLNGFDELLSPFYWEDSDICYRAYKRGWKSLFIPSAKVYHIQNFTIGTVYKRRYSRIISRKNRFIMHWKNLHQKYFWTQHLIFILLNIFFRAIIFDWEYYVSFFMALKNWKKIFLQRKIEKNASQLTDKEIFFMVNCSQRENKTF